jgi:hypothetical protein
MEINKKKINMALPFQKWFQNKINKEWVQKRIHKNNKYSETDILNSKYFRSCVYIIHVLSVNQWRISHLSYKLFVDLHLHTCFHTYYSFYSVLCGQNDNIDSLLS